MKKIICVLMSLIIIFSFNTKVFADDIEEEQENEGQIIEDILQASADIEKTPTINSRAAVIYDRTSKKVIWGKSENTRRAMASTTKIMSAIIVLENAKLTDVVEISKKAGGTGGSRLGLKAGDKLTVNDLLYGLMLRSGNDTAVALAEHVGDDLEGFAKLMNKKVSELGLKDTNFVTPHGLDEIEHYTTAHELAIITDYALNNKKFSEIVNTKSTNININNYPRTLFNTNELLGNLNGVDGVKTGFTNNAGRCLVTSTTRDSHQIICVVLGADTKKIRTTDSIKLIEYAFKNYEYIDVKKLIEDKFKTWIETNQNNIKINKSKDIKPQIKIEKIDIKNMPINKEQKKDINVDITSVKDLQAPINKNQIIGKIEIKIKEEIISSTNIIIENKIDKKNVLDYFTRIFNAI